LINGPILAPTANAIGTEPELFDMINLRADRGEFFSTVQYERADAVCVPSEAVRAAIGRHFGDRTLARVHVVPWGIADELVPLPRETVIARLRHLDLPDTYILFVGTIEPRKNVLGLLAAYRELLARMPDAPPLVLAGRLGWDYEPVLREIERPELRDRVRRLGYVDARDLPAIYAGASIFAYPSLEEGFGFPPLEAMACGTPVVAVRRSSVAEVVGGAGELAEPGALGPALLRVLADPGHRAVLRARGLQRARELTWERCAAATVDVYREVLR